MRIKKSVSVSSLLGVAFLLFFVLISTEKKQGFVVSNEVYSFGGKLDYIELYGGPRMEVRYIGNSIHPTWEGGMYFDGWYNKILGKIIWLNLWGGGLTQELIYLEKVFPLESLTKSSKYIGILGFAGTVPGVDVREGCDEGLRSGAGLVNWLNGTGDMIFSDEHMSAITSAKLYARRYNARLNQIRCSASKSE